MAVAHFLADSQCARHRRGSCHDMPVQNRIVDTSYAADKWLAERKHSTTVCRTSYLRSGPDRFAESSTKRRKTKKPQSSLLKMSEWLKKTHIRALQSV